MGTEQTLQEYFKNVNASIMVLAAVERCVASRSYASGACLDYLKEYWRHMPKELRDQILEQVRRQLEHLGFVKHNRDNWTAFVKSADMYLDSKESEDGSLRAKEVR